MQTTRHGRVKRDGEKAEIRKQKTETRTATTRVVTIPQEMRQLSPSERERRTDSFSHTNEQGRSTSNATAMPPPRRSTATNVPGESRRRKLECGGFERLHDPCLPDEGRRPVKFVAVTACPSGIAHTYMAAEQLEKTARHQGHLIKIEIQGAAGVENRLSQADVDGADAVIIASDIPIEHEERFVRCHTVARVPMHIVLKSPGTVFVQFESSMLHATPSKSAGANLYH
jgi:fructose-specific phosphotransferase system IIB component